MNFSSTGPGITEGDLFAFQRAYKVVLPTVVREFLLKHNGGALDPPMAFDWRDDQWEVTGFLSIYPQNDEIGVLSELDTLREAGIAWCVPLIWTLTEGVIGVDARPDSERIVYIERESNLWLEEEEDLGPHEVAKDFPSFLSMLYENPDPYCRVRSIGENGSAGDVAAYLADGNRIDDRGVYGNTLLYEAAAFGNLAVIKACVEQGADLTGILGIAASGGRVEAVRLLISLGANVNQPDEDGFRPLSGALGGTELQGEYAEYAAAKRATVQLLLDHGAVE